MEFIYKLLGVAKAVAEAPVTDPAAAPAEMGLAESFIGILFSLLPLIAMFAIMYFLMIRPEKKRKKKEQEMLAALKHGDRICTIGGIYGTIINIKDDTITLAVGKDNLSMVIARWGVRSVEELTIENDNGELLN